MLPNIGDGGLTYSCNSISLPGHMLSDQERRALEDLVKEAGKKLLQYWPGAQSNQDLKVTKKSDGTFVTKADFESNEILLAGLARLFPNDAIYSEESKANEVLKTAPRAWIIDPLDGTKSFIEGRDDFSVLLGLSVGVNIEFGIMYFPVRGLLAVAGQGIGAKLNGLPLAVSSVGDLRKHAIYLRHFEITNSEFVYPDWLDSGMAFLRLCRGELDGIIIKLVHHQEWDLAAPSVMIQESGGRVTDEHGKPICFKRGPVRYGHLVASNGVIHDKLLNFINTKRL